VSIDLGTPALAVDSLDELAVADSSLTPAIQTATNDQRGSIADLLQNIPLPRIGGLTLTETSVTGGQGYVVVKTTLK
jgi:hypothetical protein